MEISLINQTFELRNATDGEGFDFVDGEFLTADVEGVGYCIVVRWDDKAKCDESSIQATDLQQ